MATIRTVRTAAAVLLALGILKCRRRRPAGRRPPGARGSEVTGPQIPPAGKDAMNVSSVLRNRFSRPYRTVTALSAPTRRDLRRVGLAGPELPVTAGLTQGRLTYPGR
jgi:hypothetical protein